MSITATLYKLYEDGGQAAVYDYVNANHPDWRWSRCEPCEDDTPTHDGTCAVCGTARPSTVSAFEHAAYGEPDRATIRANGIVVDVVANEDGSVYVECYAYDGRDQAIVQHAAIDRYTNRHPNIRLGLAEVIR